VARRNNDVDDFGDFVFELLRHRPHDDDLEAAVASAKLVKEQTNRKVSPVEQPEHLAANGRPVGPKATGPKCSVTYMAFETCPGTCPFLRDSLTGERRGCYADANTFTRKHISELDAAARRIVDPPMRRLLPVLASAFQIRNAFPRGIPQDGARGGRDLRLGISGDVTCSTGAKALGRAATSWRGRGGGRVWGYTHAWPFVPRAAWGPDISILASVSTPGERRAAVLRGYRTAIVLPTFAEGRRFALAPEDPDARVVFCPHEEFGRRGLSGPTCVDCRALCTDEANMHARNIHVAFEMHGKDAARGVDSLAEAGAVHRRLRVVQ
jgi:hypothetical protein